MPGVGTIDRGQYEAAYALGHSNRRTFFRIILPQAIPHILPAYQGEIVGLSWMRAASLESINRLRPNAFQSLALGRSRFL